MEHPRRFEGIQASHAGNVGKMLQQYMQFAAAKPEQNRFEATLTICSLQSLITQCSELLKYMRLRGLPDFREPLTSVPNSLGLTSSMVLEYTYPEPLTGGSLLEHLRNALSHPAPDEDFRFRPSGFTTTGDKSGLIRAYEFTDPPWVKEDCRQHRGQELPCETEKEARGVIKQFCRGKRKDFPLDVLALEDGLFDVGHEGQPYVPLLVARVPLDALVHMTELLAEHLAGRVQSVAG